MHSVEPILANRCRNLFSHDDIGPAGTDEAEEDGPQMAVVRLALLAAGDGEGLAGAGAGPEWPVIRPASHASAEAPSSDAGEKVTLTVRPEIVRLNVCN